MKIEFYKHSLQDEDFQNVLRVLGSTFLTTGPVSANFEKKFSSMTGLEYTVALSSCTAALHLALLSLGIGPGDEVITTPLTFIATATSILHTGATPVFADVDSKSGLIDPNRVEELISSKTKAIVPVHLYGTMADMKALRNIADTYGLFLVEDAAHCIEGERDNLRPGEVSDAVCFSFYATKNLTCGEGGALSTNNKDIAEKVRLLRQHGMNKEASDRYHGLYRHWDMIDLGWKYNLDDIHAALLMAQMDRFYLQAQRRKELYEYYLRSIENLSGVSCPVLEGNSAYHLFTIWTDKDNRDAILNSLGERGVGVAVNYIAIHTLTWFRKKLGFFPEDYPNALAIGLKTISLPFYPKLKKIEIDYIVDSLKAAVNK